MKIAFTPKGWADYMHWHEHDPALVRRVHDLIGDARRSPFTGIGKPEPLRGDLKGFWSRRLTGEHRFVYRVSGVGEDQVLEIVACRFHYKR